MFASHDKFEIEIKYLEVKTKAGQIAIKILRDDDPEDARLAESKADEVKTLTTHWVQLNWKENNNIQRTCTKFDPDSGLYRLDWPLYKYCILETCMKSWNAKDNDKDVPCQRDTIARLSPIMAEALFEKYSEKTSITDKDLGN